MRKIDEGTFSLEGSSESYFIQLFEDTRNKVYVCKVYNRKGITKKFVSEKYFFTILPDFESMVHSTLVELELYSDNERKQLKKLKSYKLS